MQYSRGTCAFTRMDATNLWCVKMQACDNAAQYINCIYTNTENWCKHCLCKAEKTASSKSHDMLLLCCSLYLKVVSTTLQLESSCSIAWSCRGKTNKTQLSCSRTTTLRVLQPQEWAAAVLGYISGGGGCKATHEKTRSYNGYIRTCTTCEITIDGDHRGLFNTTATHLCTATQYYMYWLLINSLGPILINSLGPIKIS